MLPEGRAGFLWGAGVNLERNLMIVDKSPECDERRIASVHGRTNAPAEFIQSREQFPQSNKIEFKADELESAIIFTTDDLG